MHAAIDKARPKVVAESKGKRAGEPASSSANNNAPGVAPTPDPSSNDQHFQIVEDQIDGIPDPAASMTLEQYFEKMKVNKKRANGRPNQ